MTNPLKLVLIAFLGLGLVLASSSTASALPIIPTDLTPNSGPVSLPSGPTFSLNGGTVLGTFTGYIENSSSQPTGLVNELAYQTTSGQVYLMYQFTTSPSSKISSASLGNFTDAGLNINAFQANGVSLTVTSSDLPFSFFAPGTTPISTASRGPNSNGFTPIGLNFTSPLSGPSDVVVLTGSWNSLTDNGQIAYILPNGSQSVVQPTSFLSPLSPAPVPEPTSLILLGGTFLGLGGTAVWKRRKRA